MALDHFRNGYRTRPFAQVGPIVDATSVSGVIGQIIEFMKRRESFTAGINETGYFPFSAICRLEMTYDGDPDTYQGTGFYIAPDLILTCGHNLWDSGAKARTLTIEPGRHGSTTLGSFSATRDDMEVHPNYMATEDGAFDMGVIHVTTPPPNGQYFQLINYSPVPETPLAVCGYGFGGAAAADRQHLDIDRIRRLAMNGEVVEYNLQTLGGNSGSPAFVDFSNNRSGGYSPSDLLVMGIHISASDDTHNRAVLLTPEKIDWAEGGGRMSLAQGLSRRTSRPLTRVGPDGLPIVSRPRDVVGGLPLVRRGTSATMSRALSRSWIVVDETATGGMSVAKRTFGHPSFDLSGETTLSVRVPNMPQGGSVHWNIPHDLDKSKIKIKTGTGTSHSARGTSVTLQCYEPGPAAIDVSVKDASGTTVESNKYMVISPQFILVSIDPSTDAFLTSIGLGSRKAAIYAEAKEMMRHLYRNVNIRFVFPGDSLPLHLGLSSSMDYPGGVEVQPYVYYAEIVGREVTDPEQSRIDGVDSPYPAGALGRNHAIGEMDPPLENHALTRILINRFDPAFPDLAALDSAIAAGGIAASDMDMIARAWGRTIGYIAAHETGHFTMGNFVQHSGAGHLMSAGSTDLGRVAGMSRNATSPLLTDNGRASAGGLSGNMLHLFEDQLAVNPPLDASGLQRRGRVGSFSLSTSRPSHGWMNRTVTRPLDLGDSLGGTSVHLPGAEILSGWEAEAFMAGISAALSAAAGPAASGVFLAQFAGLHGILELCDQFNVTVGVGPALSGGLTALSGGGGGSAGFGIVFAPGNRIGFYGSTSEIMGWIWSAGVSAQLTVVSGGPENFGGQSSSIGGSVATVGWFDEGLVDVPIGAHVILNTQGSVIGMTFEVGVSVGIPVASLVEGYVQNIDTTTTLALGTRSRRYGRMMSAPEPTGLTGARQALIEQAIASGATPQQAEAFANRLF
ncbi:trypsin-like serine peptidase [Celeribacter arenosi]|uniref:Serine protease n=1 Tax=Celeribacter arenosi TaxID=792649 RepID=A0ABP7KGW9_9RHOB